MKSQDKKNRTACVPHRALNKVSVWTLPQASINEKDFTGWRGRVSLRDTETNAETSITVTSHVELDAKHDRIFMLANSIAHRNKDRTARVNIKEILEEMGISDRTENRHKIWRLMEQCKSVTITIESKHRADSFNLISSVHLDKQTGVIEFKIDETYYKMMKIGYKERWISVSPIMRLRESNSLAIEIGVYLQMRGAGTNAKGEPLPAKKVYENDLILYNHLFGFKSDKARVETIRRALKQLHKTSDYPVYRRIFENNYFFWTCDPSAKPAQRYKAGDDLED